ncbi:MAG TPA: hypothetical protein DD435_16535 [Cyanobacteria bacterium UBA8530]|nr:hypothetical protein [Cyanobacteria bacterium UBA8530]
MFDKRKALFLLSAIILASSCNGFPGFVNGIDGLEGQWTVKDTNLVFEITGNGVGYSVKVPDNKENKDFKGSIEGTKLTVGKLKIEIQSQIAPQIKAKTTYLGDFSPSDKSFKGTFKYGNDLPGSNREGQFTATKK